MRELSKSEPSSKSLKVSGTKVLVTHTVRPDRNSQSRYELKWILDFEKVKKTDLLLYAARSVVIAMQAKWRAAKNKYDVSEWHDVTFDVAAEMADTRKPVDRADKVSKDIDTLSKEEAREALQKLAAKAGVTIADAA